MSKLKLINDKGDTSMHELVSFDLSKVDESLLLELHLTNSTISYSIHDDRREPDLNEIKNFIIEQLKLQEFRLSEDTQRAYINIGEDDSLRKFTAHKL